MARTDLTQLLNAMSSAQELSSDTDSMRALLRSERDFFISLALARIPIEYIDMKQSYTLEKKD